MGNRTAEIQTGTNSNSNSPSLAAADEGGLMPAKIEQVLPTDLYDCAICYDTIQPTNYSKTKCDHYFCKTCLDAWLDMNTTCPMCRTVVKERVYTRVPRPAAPRPAAQPQPRVEAIPTPRREIVTRNIMERYTWELYFMASNDMKNHEFNSGFMDINKSDFAPAFAADNLLGL